MFTVNKPLLAIFCLIGAIQGHGNVSFAQTGLDNLGKMASFSKISFDHITPYNYAYATNCFHAKSYGPDYPCYKDKVLGIRNMSLDFVNHADKVSLLSNTGKPEFIDLDQASDIKTILHPDQCLFSMSQDRSKMYKNSKGGVSYYGLNDPSYIGGWHDSPYATSYSIHKDFFIAAFPSPGLLICKLGSKLSSLGAIENLLNANGIGAILGVQDAETNPSRDQSLLKETVQESWQRASSSKTTIADMIVPVLRLKLVAMKPLKTDADANGVCRISSNSKPGTEIPTGEILWLSTMNKATATTPWSSLWFDSSNNAYEISCSLGNSATFSDFFQSWTDVLEPTVDGFR